MRRAHRLELALAPAKNATSKLRLAGTRGQEDECLAYEAQQGLDMAVTRLERMVDLQRRHDAEVARGQ